MTQFIESVKEYPSDLSGTLDLTSTSSAEQGIVLGKAQGSNMTASGRAPAMPAVVSFKQKTDEEVVSSLSEEHESNDEVIEIDLMEEEYFSAENVHVLNKKYKALKSRVLEDTKKKERDAKICKLPPTVIMAKPVTVKRGGSSSVSTTRIVTKAISKDPRRMERPGSTPASSGSEHRIRSGSSNRSLSTHSPPSRGRSGNSRLPSPVYVKMSGSQDGNEVYDSAMSQGDSGGEPSPTGDGFPEFRPSGKGTPRSIRPNKVNSQTLQKVPVSEDAALVSPPPAAHL